MQGCVHLRFCVGASCILLYVTAVLLTSPRGSRPHRPGSPLAATPDQVSADAQAVAAGSPRARVGASRRGECPCLDSGELHPPLVVETCLSGSSRYRSCSYSRRSEEAHV